MKLILHFFIKYLSRIGFIVLLPGIAYGQVCTGLYRDGGICSCGIGSSLSNDCAGMGTDSNCISKINQSGSSESVVESKNVSPSSYNATVGTHTFSNTTEANQQYQCDWDGSGYSNARFVISDTDNAPIANSINFTGSLQVGKTLTGNYTYTDADSDAENGTTFKWSRSNDVNGTGKIYISGATNSTYILTSDDTGKFISFEVTPQNDKATGSMVESLRLYIKAGLDALSAPTASGSAMFTLQDICNRLNIGTAGSKRGSTFIEPTAAPAPTDCSLNTIMAKLPALDDSNGASTSDVTAGKTFWSLKSGDWGLQTGTQ